jgi:hypothetical protein
MVDDIQQDDGSPQAGVLLDTLIGWVGIVRDYYREVVRILKPGITSMKTLIKWGVPEQSLGVIVELNSSTRP